MNTENDTATNSWHGASWSEADWHGANQRYLMAALADVREALKHHAAGAQGKAQETDEDTGERTDLGEISRTMPAPPALEVLCAAFGLSPFERDVLLLTAGPELDSGFARLCGAAQGNAARAHPTFSLALAALPDAHWSALTPAAPLRHWRLIEVATSPSDTTLMLSPLRMDEYVLHYLAGAPHLDERLAGMLKAVRPEGALVPSHRDLAAQLARTWSKASGLSRLPVVQLCGSEVVGKRMIAAAACSSLGLTLYVLDAHVVPSTAAELDALIRLWEREAALGASALLLNCEYLDAADTARSFALTQLMGSVRSPLIVTTRERWGTPLLTQTSMIAFDVREPSTSEQHAVWSSALEAVGAELNGSVDTLVSQFSLSAPIIHAACAEAQGKIEDGKLKVEDSDSRSAISDFQFSIVWDACRMQARPRLDDLAQRIESAAGWDELVLPESQRQTLREVALQVRQRGKVYGSWGFGAKGARGLGISALFSGQSGTGKTMAAEVLANELRLDLYRIDLSGVVSKYIGETEKNLRRVFDAAEEGGAVLLFDEADALFGKRSEVKDSHDRYANIEVSYLLQRMEAYRGLAILTTNMKDALDPAFSRRIRFVVQFPFPDAVQRAEIWRRIFPLETPTDNLCAEKLARLNVAGGNIRNIALNAAFLAAVEGEPVGMKHLLRAARSEYSKLEKPLTETEIGGWA